MKIIIRTNVLKAHLQTVSKLKSRAELQTVLFNDEHAWSGDGKVMMRTPKQGAFIAEKSGSVLVKFDQFSMPAGCESAVVDTDTGCVYLLKSSYSHVEPLPNELHKYAARIAKVSVVDICYPDVSRLSHTRGSVSDIAVMSCNLEKIHKVARALAGQSKAVDISFQKGKQSTFMATIKHGFAVCEMFVKVAK